MSDILTVVISNILDNDIDGSYRNSISVLSSKYPRLYHWKSASVKQCDEDVLLATKTVIEAVLQADTLMKQSQYDKNSAGLIAKIIIKTLKLASKILAGMLLTNPFKIGVAYNALYNVIKFLEKKNKF